MMSAGYRSGNQQWSQHCACLIHCGMQSKARTMPHDFGRFRKEYISCRTAQALPGTLRDDQQRRCLPTAGESQTGNNHQIQKIA